MEAPPYNSIPDQQITLESYASCTYGNEALYANGNLFITDLFYKLFKKIKITSLTVQGYGNISAKYLGKQGGSRIEFNLNTEYILNNYDYISITSYRYTQARGEYTQWSAIIIIYN